MVLVQVEHELIRREPPPHTPLELDDQPHRQARLVGLQAEQEEGAPLDEPLELETRKKAARDTLDALDGGELLQCTRHLPCAPLLLVLALHECKALLLDTHCLDPPLRAPLRILLAPAALVLLGSEREHLAACADAQLRSVVELHHACRRLLPRGLPLHNASVEQPAAMRHLQLYDALLVPPLPPLGRVVTRCAMEVHDERECTPIRGLRVHVDRRCSH